MKHTFYLTFFAACLVAEIGLGKAAPSPSSTFVAENNENLEASKRVARQAPPPPPPPPEGMPPPPKGMPPPPEGMPPAPDGMPPPPQGFSRKRREAKGGGSMPTRKG